MQEACYAQEKGYEEGGEVGGLKVFLLFDKELLRNVKCSLVFLLDKMSNDTEKNFVDCELDLPRAEILERINFLRTRVRGRRTIKLILTDGVSEKSREAHGTLVEVAASFGDCKSRVLMDGVAGLPYGERVENLGIDSKDLRSLANAVNRRHLFSRGIAVWVKQSVGKAVAILGFPDGTVEVPNPSTLSGQKSDQFALVFDAVRRAKNKGTKMLLTALLNADSAVEMSVLGEYVGVSVEVLRTLIASTNKGILYSFGIKIFVDDDAAVLRQGSGDSDCIEMNESLPEKRMEALELATRSEIRMAAGLAESPDLRKFLESFVNRRKRAEDGMQELLNDIYGSGTDMFSKRLELNTALEPLGFQIVVVPRGFTGGDEESYFWEIHTTKVQVADAVLQDVRQRHHEVFNISNMIAGVPARKLLKSLVGKYSGVYASTIPGDPREVAKATEYVNRHTFAVVDCKIYRRNGVLILGPKKGSIIVSGEVENFKEQVEAVLSGGEKKTDDLEGRILQLRSQLEVATAELSEKTRGLDKLTLVLRELEVNISALRAEVGAKDIQVSTLLEDVRRLKLQLDERPLEVNPKAGPGQVGSSVGVDQILHIADIVGGKKFVVASSAAKDGCSGYVGDVVVGLKTSDPEFLEWMAKYSDNLGKGGWALVRVEGKSRVYAISYRHLKPS